MTVLYIRKPSTEANDTELLPTEALNWKPQIQTSQIEASLAERIEFECVRKGFRVTWIDRLQITRTKLLDADGDKFNVQKANRSKSTLLFRTFARSHLPQTNHRESVHERIGTATNINFRCGIHANT